MAQLVMTQAPWLPLRQDLELIQGPLSDSGSPTWTLYDRTAHRYFRIGWMEFEILARWDMGSPQSIAQAVSDQTPVEAAPEDVERVGRFALAHSLLRDPTPEGSKRMARLKAMRRKTLWDVLSKYSIFFRLTLAHPDRFLASTLPVARLFLNRHVAWLTALMALVGIYLITRDFSQFRQDLQVIFTVEGALLVGGSLIGVKVFHELGHAYVAKMHGCRVPAMGAAFLLFMPLFWTDVTDAWKLQDRKERLRIDAAGLGVELALASLATVLWSVLPPGIMRTTAYVLATTTWLVSITINASPFMRYDGYYILSDLMDEPNLQERSFAMALWAIRRHLLGLPDPPPESIPTGRERLMIAYAMGCWIYRFFLFWSIALLVYHFFFKLLGIIMMLVQINQMMIKPVAHQISVLHGRRAEIRTVSAVVKLSLMAVALAGLLAIPWRGSVQGYGVLIHDRQSLVYAIQPAQVADTPVSNGDRVEAGQVLVRLTSPDLENRIGLAQLRVQVLRSKLEAMSLEPKLMRDFSPTVFELEGANAELAGYEHLRDELSPRAQVSGVVRDLPAWLAPGQWVAGGEILGVVVGGTHEVEAYVPEVDQERIAPGAMGKFHPASGQPVLELVVDTIGPAAVRDLTRQELSSLSGGPIQVRKADSGRLVPVESFNKLICRVSGQEPPLSMSLTGTVVISARPVSLFSLVWRNTLGILIRESGLSS